MASRRTVRTAWAGLIALVLAGMAGCAHERVEPDGAPAIWTGMGVTLRVPPGTWTIRDTEKGTVSFVCQPGGREIALMRVPAGPKDADWLPLANLFVEFREKKELRRWKGVIASGESVRGVEYDIVLDGRHVRIQACSTRRGAWHYDLAEWNYGERPILESLLSGWTLPADAVEVKAR